MLNISAYTQSSLLSLQPILPMSRCDVVPPITPQISPTLYSRPRRIQPGGHLLFLPLAHGICANPLYSTKIRRTPLFHCSSRLHADEAVTASWTPPLEPSPQPEFSSAIIWAALQRVFPRLPGLGCRPIRAYVPTKCILQFPQTNYLQCSLCPPRRHLRNTAIFGYLGAQERFVRCALATVSFVLRSFIVPNSPTVGKFILAFV